MAGRRKQRTRNKQRSKGTNIKEWFIPATIIFLRGLFAELAAFGVISIPTEEVTARRLTEKFLLLILSVVGYFVFDYLSHVRSR